MKKPHFTAGADSEKAKNQATLGLHAKNHRTALTTLDFCAKHKRNQKKTGFSAKSAKHPREVLKFSAKRNHPPPTPFLKENFKNTPRGGTSEADVFL